MDDELGVGGGVKDGPVGLELVADGVGVGVDGVDVGLGPALAFLPLLFLAPLSLHAGPPYITDDPEPVDYRHWEIYLASMLSHDGAGWSGTLPHTEVNYGAAQNLQLHVIAPASFNHPDGETVSSGYGDKGRKARSQGDRPCGRRRCLR